MGKGQVEQFRNSGAMPGSGAIRMFVRLDVSFAHNPLLLDRRGRLATGVQPSLFQSYTIGQDVVTFQHEARTATVGVASANVFHFDPQHAEIPWEFFFSKLTDAGVSAITGYRMVTNYAVPATQLFDQMVKAVADQMKPALIEPTIFGKLFDIGQVYTLQNASGHMVNINVGPMLRNQWSSLLGPAVAVIEPQLPECAWNVGVFHPKPIENSMSLRDARRTLTQIIGEWQETVQRYVTALPAS